MSHLNSSTNNMSAADLRSASIDKLRAKKRRVRYRNTNMALIDTPTNELSTEPYKSTWNDRNKFKMPPCNMSCKCSYCRLPKLQGASASKKIYSDDLYAAYDSNTINDEVSLFNDELDRKAIDGVTYSYDRPGPSHGSQILSQALGAAIDKMENKQLERLIKDEYDVVETDDSASSDDDFELI